MSDYFITSSIAIAALLLTVYFVFRKEGREDSSTAAHRLIKLEAELATQRIELANQQARQQGFQAEIENVADHSARERQVLAEGFRREHEALKEQIKDQIKDVPTMRELLYRMVERLENVKETNIKLDHKMDRIVELLTHKN